MRWVWRLRPAKVLVPLVLIAGLPGALIISDVRAESSGRAFLAVAEANGMSIRYGIPGFVAVDNYIDGGGPSSQAFVGSDGSAGGFASLPYPGAAAVGYSGLVNFVTGQSPPNYPFYVAASHPTQPEQTLSDPSGSYALRATAREAQATGDAGFAPEPGVRGVPEETGQENAVPVTQASSEVAAAGSTVTATASSVANGLSFGPLSIGRMHSRSVTTYEDGAEQPTTTTELVIEGGRANDVAFSFGREGFQFAQQGIPLPAGDGLAALNQALAPAGLSVRFDEAAPLQGGAVAAALEVTSVAEVPGAGNGTFVMRFGGATSFVSLGGDSGNPLLEDVSPPAPVEAPAPDPGPPGPAPVTASAEPPSTAGTEVPGLLDLPPPALTGAPGSLDFGAGGGYAATGPSSGYEAAAGLGGSGDGTPVPAPAATGGSPLGAQPALLAVGQRDVGGLSIVAGVLMAAAVLGVALAALGTRRARAWMD